MQRILDLDPDTYQRHRFHTQERDWAETNCYVDIWIELLHAFGYEPVAALPYTLAIDFEGDQWTFFKFPLTDIYELFGIDVQELAVWKSLVSHVEEQVGLGRPVLVELDSYFLPDTAGMAYKLEHVKSTVAVNEIDVENRQMGYFHGQGYYRLEGDDFIDVFRLRDDPDPAVLPPYVEIAKFRDTAPLNPSEVLDRSIALLKRQIRLLPDTNPFELFKPKLEQDLQWLMNESLETFHKYSFATLRQFGACYELSANYIEWLSDQKIEGLEEAQKNLKSISETAKVFQFQLARAMSRKKPLDLTPVNAMSDSWQTTMDILRQKFG